MARGGKRTGAGRKAGSPNSRTKLVEEAVSATGVTPLAYMLSVMRDPDADQSRRDDMAKAASPYVHSKMPIAVVAPQSPNAETSIDDDHILNLYLNGIHEESDQG